MEINARFFTWDGVMPGKNIDWEISPEERDWGLLVSSSSKGASSVPWLPRGQTSSKHSMTSQGEEVIILMCSALVQPQLELSVQGWDPTVKKDVKVLECIQGGQQSWWKVWRAVMSGWGLWIYMVWRNGGWGATSLLPNSFLRRGRSEWDAELLSPESSGRVRGNSSKLPHGRNRLGIEQFYTKKVVKHWKGLPGEVANAPSLPVLKRYLDKALNKRP